MKRLRLLLVPAVGFILAITLTACQGDTSPATNVTATTATLTANVSCNGGSPNPCYWYWEWGTGTAYQFQSSVFGPASVVISTTLTYNVTGLTPSTIYNYKFCGKGDNLTTYGCVGPTSFTTAASTTATTTTTTTTPPTTTTTTQPSGGQTCVTGDNQGLPTNGAYDDSANINASNGYNTYVEDQIFDDVDINNNITLCGSSPGNWNVTLNAAAGPDGGAVQGYPDIQQLYNNWSSSGGNTPIASLTGLTSTFNTTNPPDSVGNWEMAYDLWFSNYGSDIMIWENTSNSRGLASNYGGATIDNPNVTIDGQSYALIHYGGGSQPERMLVHNTNASSGTENILADLQWLEANGYLPSGDSLGQVNFGWELCNTDGQTLTYAVNAYTLTRTPASG
jgi:hypothetical protein